MLPPRRAALPLGTSSLGACGALLPREPRPVEGSRGSRPARRSCVPSLPTGGGGSLHRRSGGRERGGGSVQWGSIEAGREAGRTSSCGCAAVRADRRVGGGLRGRAAAGADRRRGRDLERALLPPRVGGGGGPGRPLVEPLAETVHVEGRRTRAAGRGTASRSARPPSPALIDGLAVSDLAQTTVDPNRPGVPRGRSPELVLLAEKRREDRIRARGSAASSAGLARGLRRQPVRPTRAGVRRVQLPPGRRGSPLFAAASTVRIASVGERQLGWYGATTTSTRWNSLRSE